MNPIRLDSIYYGAFALQWLALLAAASLGGWGMVLGAGAAGTLFLGASLLVGSRGRDLHSGEQAAHFAMVVAIILALLTLPFGGIDLCVLSLLLGMIVANNLALRTRRNLYFSYLATLFMVLYAASRSYGNLFTLWITLYVLAGVFTLMLAHTDARLDASMGDDNIHPCLSWLAVFLVSFCLLAGTGMIYLLFPRLPPVQLSAFPSSGGTDYDDHSFDRNRSKSEGNNGEKEMAAGGASGPGEGEGARPDRQPLDISRCGDADHRLMFYLRADRPLYVRTGVYDRFDGTLWSDSDQRDIAIYRPQHRFVFDGIRTKAPGETVYQHYVIRDYDSAVLPAAARPITLDFPGNTVRLDREGEIAAIRPLSRGTEYTVKSYREVVEAHITDGNGNKEIDTARYLQVPPMVTERTAGLAASIAAPAENDLQRAILVESYLRETYPYTLTTYGRHPQAGLVEWFLFEERIGHCELFASAMAMMLRQLGIPARLVTGYVTPPSNPITGYQEVKNPGHAWVEAWFPQHGWVTFEPTPGWNSSNLEESPLFIISLIRYLEERVRMTNRESFLDADSPEFLRFLTSLLKTLWAAVQFLLSLLALAWSRLRPWLPTMGGWLAATVAAVFAARYLLLPWFGGQLSLLRMRLIAGRPDRERILLGWYEMECSFSRIGHPRRESVTPDEYRREIDALAPEHRSNTELLCILFQRARYGIAFISAEETAESLGAAVRLIRTTMHPVPPEWMARCLDKNRTRS
jgi:transglutaminase-like putative cysteine protease